MASVGAKKRAKQENDRKRQERIRRKDGRKTRAEWLAENSVEARKPWVAEGVSRSTWYRSKGRAHDQYA